MLKELKIGQVAILAAMGYLPEREKPTLTGQGYSICTGRVGTMNAEKVIAAIETAAKREGIISDLYRDEHSLYHAALEALAGISRGQLALGSVLRTVGLSFAVVRGYKNALDTTEGIWLAVALYGTIGAPVKGFEHETIGLGINHL